MTHRSLSSLRRRGPDEIGFWFDGELGIGHTRLAIIGLDENGTQPLENHRHVLALNGEIYNFLDLRRRLEKEGVRIRGTSDSEVLLHAWTRWGPAILPELTGFWAFAIYDKQQRKLSLVRDQYGIKPLYYQVRDGAVTASSLIRAIVETSPMPLHLDYNALSEYVRYQFTFGNKTFFQEVKKVMPGEIVEIDIDTAAVTTRIYEDIFTIRPESYRHADQEWVEETRELMRQCVVESTISDTSFTTFCSGGIDSSLITRLADPEIAYHCNYSDPECNETFFAKQVVDGTNIRLFTVNAREEFDLVQSLGDIVNDFDELSIGSVILPLEDLLGQVKRRYKVILTGTGGDELFGGYVRFQLVRGECYQDSYKALFDRLRAVPTPAQRFEITHRKGDVSYYRFYDDAASTAFADAYESCNGHGDDTQAMLRFDRKYFLQGLLNIDDKMCGRHSLESRPSFLHQQFVRHLVGVDPRSLFEGEELKPLLRRLAAATLPQNVIKRPDKMGFTTPIGDFVNRSVHRIREQIFDSPFAELYNLTGIRLNAETKFSREVFGLLMLDLWLNRYAGQHGQVHGAVA
jgi:asparagine synthase (glutamine-hydrolysing)